MHSIALLRRVACAASLLVALSATAYAAGTLTIDQLLSLKSAGRPRISADGRFVAYEVTETDWKENAYVTHLWLADVQSGRAFQLTRGKKSSDGAQWSPDGRWLAFMTERESGAITPPADGAEKKKEDAKSEKKESDAKADARQIWLISPEGGEAWPLTRHGAKIESFHWSRDGKRIAFTAPVPEAKAAKDRKEKYSEYEVFEEDFQQNQLWLIDVVAETATEPHDAKQITADPKVNVEGFDWSPDGRRIAFSGTSNPLLAYSGSADLYLVDLARDNAVKRIVALEGPDANPRFSPDGAELAFTTALAQPYYFYANDRIARVRIDEVMQHPATKPADVDDLTPAFDEDASLLEWAPEGLYFRALQKTSSHLWRIDPRDKSVARVTSPDVFFVGEVTFTRDFRAIAFSAPDATHVQEIFVAQLPTGGQPLAPRKLTDMTAQLAGFTLGTV
ncbi:MAG TPA: hypothetical protein VEZ11_03995, partial [Thermoanaerobaculia bacterium]|nr:hypothetical protein [Thermoanaerobaculia bacterium]